MEGFAAAVVAVYNFMQQTWSIGKYNISYWEIFLFTIILSAFWFFVRQHLDVDD